MIDPLSDMLTRIRNALLVEYTKVIIPYSTLKFEVAKILEQEGYIKGFSKDRQEQHDMLVLDLKYYNDESVIKGIEMATSDRWKELCERNFELSDEEDAKYFKRLPEIDVSKLRNHLQKVIKVVNEAEFDLGGWVKFKFLLMVDQKEWPQEMFRWNIVKKGDFPRGIGIDTDLLEDNPYQYYVIGAAIENIWGLYSIKHDDVLPNIWDLF